MKPLLLLLPCLALCILAACTMRNDEQDLQAFIDKHVKAYEPKFKAMNLADWNANATGEKKYYDEKAAVELEIRQMYSNKKEFQQLKQWKEAGTIRDTLLQRQLIVLYNNYLTNQFDTTLMRMIVEKGAAIAAAFNTFRPVLDGKEVDDNTINSILKNERNSDRRRRAWEASKEVGIKVGPMVVELARLRNEAARQLGYKNFYELSLAANEQTVEEITAIFDELKELTDEPFRKLKADIDAGLAARYGIKPAAMQAWHYQDRFFQEAPQLGGVDLDKYFKGKKVDELGRTFFTGIGMPVEDILKNSDIYGRKGKYQHAFENDIDRAGDIRVMLSVVDNHGWMSTMMHELGHAVYSKYVARDLPFLLRVESHSFLTEAIAMLLERQPSNAEWLQTFAGMPARDADAVRKTGREQLRMHALIFCRWTQVMMRFEKGLYENPDQDLNALWWNLVSEYQMIPRPEKRNAPDWAAKIHLAQYPAYYHNYQLGELAASQLQHTIAVKILGRKAGEDVCFAAKPAVGDYLKAKVFAPGSKLRWDELMKFATGEPLSAKFFAEEYVK